jgi:hypothetical protein
MSVRNGETTCFQRTISEQELERVFNGAIAHFPNSSDAVIGPAPQTAHMPAERVGHLASGELRAEGRKFSAVQI